MKFPAHIELSLFCAAEPARQSRRASEVSAVQVQSPAGSRPPIQILVTAPEGKIHALRVKIVRHGPDGMGTIKPDDEYPDYAPAR